MPVCICKFLATMETGIKSTSVDCAKSVTLSKLVWIGSLNRIRFVTRFHQYLNSCRRMCNRKKKMYLQYLIKNFSINLSRDTLLIYLFHERLIASPRKCKHINATGTRQEIYISRERYVTQGDEGLPCCTREGGKLAQIHEFQMDRAESPWDPFRGSFPHVWNILGQTGLLAGTCGGGQRKLR